MCAAIPKGMRALLLIAALAAPAFAQGSIFPDKNLKKAARQLEASTISEDGRALLKQKMKSHAKEAEKLSVAVATVRLAEVQRLAQDIALEPRLDPAAGAAVKLPPRFFELQDELRKRSEALSEAARANELSGTLEKYGQLVETCTACHAAFVTEKK